jgi:hypothetical protein
MKNIPRRPHHHEVSMLTAVEPLNHHDMNGAVHRIPTPVKGRRKQRVTITLPVALLERLRNAVYWTGHGTLARLITEALEQSVTNMEQSNGQAFPQRLAPLKRGRPSTKQRSAPSPDATVRAESSF